MLWLVDALGFSSVWVALAAGALVAATARTFDTPLSPALFGIAVAGTLGVYCLDRVRDLQPDRTTAPLRSAFVERHQAAMMTCAIAALMVAGVCALLLGPAALLSAVFAGGLGLLHRRLKHVPFLKGVYVAAAWVAVTVVLPALLMQPRPAPTAVGWAVAIVGLALLGNAIASSARDDEASAAVLGPRRALRVALACAVAGMLVGRLAPAPIRQLTPIATVTVVALLGFRSSERYGFLLDGALTAGALWVLR